MSFIKDPKLEEEIRILKNYGLTDEEIEGYVDIFEYNKIKVKKVRVVNSKKLLN